MATIKITPRTNIDGWTKARVQETIRTDDRQLERVIVLVNSLQTPVEDQTATTQIWNQRGWSMTDSKRGKRWATFIKRGYGLREWEKPVARKAASKYWRQVLTAIAVKKGYTVE